MLGNGHDQHFITSPLHGLPSLSYIQLHLCDETPTTSEHASTPCPLWHWLEDDVMWLGVPLCSPVQLCHCYDVLQVPMLHLAWPLAHINA